MLAKKFSRLFTTLVAAALLLIAPSAFAQARYQFDLPAQPLEDSLKAVGRITGTNVLFEPRAVQGKIAKAVRGDLTADEALRQIVADTTLEVKQSSDSTVIIRERGTKTESDERRKTDLDKPVQLEGIVVSAQKRSEFIQDVPVPVTAISGDTLIAGNQLRLQDYYTRIPGFSVAPAIVGVQTLSIRGITTGYGTNPTVGITVDDVPYGSSTMLGGGQQVPDIDPNDLARVEVLRGPQGTLYGANSIGGLLKFVTVDPSTAGVSGRVQVGASKVYNGDQFGYNVRGSINVPLSDTWAVRVSGFVRRDPGYIDDPVHGTKGVNRADIHGGRLSALWAPSDTFSLKLGAIIQKSNGNGASSVDPAVGDLQQVRLPGSGVYERKIQAYNAILTAKLGSADLTALTGYNINGFTDSFDGGFAYGPLVRPRFGVTGAELFSNNETKKFTQEIRFSVPIGQRLEWLFGGFYTDEDTQYWQDERGADPITGVRVGSLRLTNFPSTFKEQAAFTNLTFHITDRFDIQIGGRQSEIRQSYQQTQTGVGALPTGNVPERGSKANPFTYLVTPRFKVSSDLMVYARLASGYRAGGPNQDAGAGTPSQYDPDTTRNYEIGVKGDFLDRALLFDVSLYHIDWKDIQLVLINPQTVRSYTANGSGAKSQGVELSVETRPLKGLKIAAWLTWSDAELTENIPRTATVRAVAGDRLPNASRFSGNLSADQEFSVASGVTGVIGGSVGYVGDKKSVFTGTGVRQTFPAYTKVDLRAGLRYESWMADLFVNNVTDKRGVLYGGLGALPPFAFFYIQPRTIGLSLTRAF